VSLGSSSKPARGVASGRGTRASTQTRTHTLNTCAGAAARLLPGPRVVAIQGAGGQPGSQQPRRMMAVSACPHASPCVCARACVRALRCRPPLREALGPPHSPPCTPMRSSRPWCRRMRRRRTRCSKWCVRAPRSSRRAHAAPCTLLARTWTGSAGSMHASPPGTAKLTVRWAARAHASHPPGWPTPACADTHPHRLRPRRSRAPRSGRTWSGPKSVSSGGWART